MELAGLVKSWLGLSGGISLHEAFTHSPWYRLATIVGDSSRENCQGLHLDSALGKNGPVLLVSGNKGQELARYYANGYAADLLTERLTLLPEEAAPNRQAILERLARMTMTNAEWELSRRGFPSFRLLLEQSVWYRLAYHCFLAFGSEELSMEPIIDLKTGNFTLACNQSGRGWSSGWSYPGTWSGLYSKV